MKTSVEKVFELLVPIGKEQEEEYRLHSFEFPDDIMAWYVYIQISSFWDEVEFAQFLYENKRYKQIIHPARKLTQHYVNLAYLKKQNNKGRIQEVKYDVGRTLQDECRYSQDKQEEYEGLWNKLQIQGYDLYNGEKIKYDKVRMPEKMKEIGFNDQHYHLYRMYSQYLHGNAVMSSFIPSKTGIIPYIAFLVRIMVDFCDLDLNGGKFSPTNKEIQSQIELSIQKEKT